MHAFLHLYSYVSARRPFSIYHDRDDRRLSIESAPFHTRSTGTPSQLTTCCTIGVVDRKLSARSANA